MKVIETLYKGYLFRSRLEARWAVFFDELALKWEYEPEGFDLGNAGWYLPDFYLPNLGLYWEIKPVNGCADSDWIKFENFEKRLVVAFGLPGGFDDYHSYCFGNGSEGWTSWGDGQGGFLAQCPKCKMVGFTYAGWAGYIPGCSCFINQPDNKKAYKTSGITHDSFMRAVYSARSARFSR